MNADEKAALGALETDWNSTLALLKSLVAMPTVSFAPWPKEPLFACADRIESELRALSPDLLTRLKSPEVPDDAVPVLFAHWKAPAGAKTILLYAHYDVQPPMDLSDWTTPPFEPREREGRLYGRGTADDKAGVAIHLAALKAWTKASGGLPCGVKVLFEGQEEVGSVGLEKLLRANRGLLDADAVLIADCGNYDVGIPTLTTSLRGMNAVDVELRTMASPLHSGSWGGIAPDVGIMFARAIASLADDWGGLSFELPRPGEKGPERVLPTPDEALMRRQVGLPEGADFPFPADRLWRRCWDEPSLTITSLECGKVGESGNVIHNVLRSRIGLRVPFGHDVDEATRALVEALRTALPDWVELKAEPEDSARPWATGTDHPLTRLAAGAMAEAFGRDVVFAGCGASIPLAQLFGELLPGAPVLLTGVEDPYSAPHAPDESLELSDFFSSAKAETALLGRLSS